MTKESIEYRAGTLEDVPGVALFLENIIQENPLVKLFEHDLAKCAKVLRNVIQDNRGVIIVAVKDDIILGTIILGKTTIWWASKDLFTDLAFYVNPQYRHLGIQKKLLEVVKEFADNVGIPVLIDVFNDSEENDKLVRFLSIQGFKNVGFKALYTPTKG
jgi:GNAT superfamily N-acetyltransferase